MDKAKRIILLFVDTYKKWLDDRAVRMAAALAYYGLFSLAPILAFMTGFVGALVDRFLGDIVGVVNLDLILSGFFSPEVAELIKQLVEDANSINSFDESLPLVSVIGIGIVLWGATSIFKYLHEALNTIWGVKPIVEGGFWVTVRRYAVSFLIVFVLGLAFVLYLLLITVFSILLPGLSKLVPDALEILPDFRMLQIAQFLILFVVMTLLFSAFYKILPDVDIKWRDVFVGAAFTAILFGLGMLILSIYFTFYSSTLLGIAGSLVVLLLWFYYTAQIFLFGAEFTYLYATRYGSQIRPAGYINDELDILEGTEESGPSVESVD